MLKYIYLDMVSMVRFLPWGAVGMIISATLLWGTDKVRKRLGREPGAMLPRILFCTYISLILIITFFSRESGSRQGMDLKLFSTWGINDRNNAFVVENVLLFIPYGLLGAWASARMRRFPVSLAVGAAASLGIEFLQLATRRGYFQIDDILTNTLGTIIGYGIFCILAHCRR